MIEQEAMGEGRASERRTLQEPEGTSRQACRSSGSRQWPGIYRQWKPWVPGPPGRGAPEILHGRWRHTKLEPRVAGWSQKVVNTALGSGRLVIRDGFACGGKPDTA